MEAQEYITKEFVTRLVYKEMIHQQETFDYYGWELETLDFASEGGFTFIAAHIKMPTSKRSHRYLLMTLSGSMEIWKDSNMIDADKFMHIKDTQNRVTAYFNHISNKLSIL